MSQKLRLDRAFTNGRIVYIQLEVNDRIKAPAGHVWMILNGHVSHITGTDSSTYIVREGELKYKFMTKILAASANGGYPLFNTEPVEDQAQWQPIFILGNAEIVFVGGTNAAIQLTVLEWKT